MLAYAPTFQATMGNSLDHCDVWDEWFFVAVGRLVKVEILTDGAGVLMEQPAQDLSQILNQVRMGHGFPHQVLLGGVQVVVVGYLVFYVLCHDMLLSRGQIPYPRFLDPAYNVLW